jgi:GT2 family glycosyltransferase
MADLLASVVIPTRNRPQSVRACLDALAAQTMPPGSFEVIVVDDGGEPPLAVDPTASAGIFPLTVMRQEHAGPGTARNRGVDHARGEVVVFTDDDCLPTPSWLEKMVTAVRREPRGLVGGATLNGLPRSLCAETSHLILEIVYEHCNRDGSGSSFFASNNMACSRAAYLGIGGFDEAFRVASEDRDLCDRWRSHGEPLRWQRDAFVEHRHPQNFREFTRLHFRYGRGAYRYHRERRARGGGMSSRDVSMHARLPGYVWSRRRRWSLGRGLAIGAMMAWWEIVNAAGFAWEGLARAWTRPCTAPASCGTGRPEGRQASTSRIGSTCSTPTSFWSRPPKK